jgi:UDPglucose--hexose-1-phosphate uridylyltransferase
MELRKDPITRSWVVVGHPENPPVAAEPCPLCPGQEGDTRTLLALPASGAWQVRVFPHFDPLYRIEGEACRSAEGIYDWMRPVGAHEILVETSAHDQRLSRLSDAEIETVLHAYALRLTDLKKDLRFKFIAVFKNQGATAGQDWPHACSQITATTFVPRRVLYELRAAREYFQHKDRCVFCDIVRQEEKQRARIVDTQGDYVAFCPYASRVPFEIWLISKKHNHLFESPRPAARRANLAILLGRVLRRLEQLTPDFHLVLHTAPNTAHPKGELSEYWKTIAGDYHWHLEILPILTPRSKSYSFKEVYFNPVLPEQAAEKLRQLDPSR